MKFDFFHEILTEQRCYDYTAWHVEFIQAEINRMKFDYPNCVFPALLGGPMGYWKCPSTKVSHIAAPSKNGLVLIEKEFGIDLPDDFKTFYLLHNEALLLGRNPVLIMKPETIISISNELREAHEIAKDLPRHVIRFGWLGTDSYFLLLYKADIKKWEVWCSSYSHATDFELQNGCAWGGPCDQSFTDWLMRMVETDGAPLHPNFDEEDDYFVKRIT